MAGGRGERFWPKSRIDMPKQFLTLNETDESMLQLTVSRILPLVEMEDIYIATSEKYREIVKQQLPELPDGNILCEPVSRNTAACIGLGAVHIAKKYGDAVMYVLPSDHLIKNTMLFRRTLNEAACIAEEGPRLVTLGITPDYPETGYGYIKIDPAVSAGRAFGVECFVEKPDRATAKRYVMSEQYLWNSGMFIWKVSTILENIERYLPDTYSGLMRIGEAIGTDSEESVLEKEFTGFPSVSVDYGIMEKAETIFVCACSFGWDDVGSWLAMERIQPINEFGNVIKGAAVTVDTKNTIIQGDKRLIATVGIEDLIIVDTEDALLVCDKNSAGEIKSVTEKLRLCGKTEFL